MQIGLEVVQPSQNETEEAPRHFDSHQLYHPIMCTIIPFTYGVLTVLNLPQSSFSQLAFYPQLLAEPYNVALPIQVVTWRSQQVSRSPWVGRRTGKITSGETASIPLGQRSVSECMC